jgi:nitrous oxidase accessory protein NosD
MHLDDNPEDAVAMYVCLFVRLKRLLLLLPLLLPAAPAAAAADCSQSLQSLADSAPQGGTVLVPACTYHETVLVGHAVTLDGQNQATVDGDNVRDRWFWIAASNVTIRNFTMRGANPVSLQGGIGTLAGISNIIIDHNNLGPTWSGTTISIGGTTDSRVSNNQIHHGGQLGILTYQNTRLVIEANHIFSNNTTGTDPHWAGAGLKANNDTGLSIINNEADHNNGPALWVDVGATNITIAGNWVHDQQHTPIYVEVSSFADVYDNLVTSANTDPQDDNGGCVVVYGGGHVNVHDNACQDTLPLRAQLDARPDNMPDAGHNVVLQNNRLVRPMPNQATSWWQWDPSGPLIPGTNGNVDSGNQILSSLATPTPTPLPKPTATSIPMVVCEVKVRLNGIEGPWKPCV